jgi:hypothetical protein
MDTVITWLDLGIFVCLIVSWISLPSSSETAKTYVVQGVA